MNSLLARQDARDERTDASAGAGAAAGGGAGVGVNGGGGGMGVEELVEGLEPLHQVSGWDAKPLSTDFKNHVKLVKCFLPPTPPLPSAPQ